VQEPKCPFCDRVIGRREMEMWGTFNCPQCGRLLRVRRNYAARILRLVVISLVVWLIAIYLWASYGGLQLGLVSLAVIGAIEAVILQLLPIHLEPGAPGGLGIS
jgi:predicted RNA-binding Zn-ribbon protein involved in translation (DUF1610 family)